MVLLIVQWPARPIAGGRWLLEVAASVKTRGKGALALAVISLSGILPPSCYADATKKSARYRVKSGAPPGASYKKKRKDVTHGRDPDREVHKTHCRDPPLRIVVRSGGGAGALLDGNM